MDGETSENEKKPKRPAMFTPRDVAERMGVSQETVIRWIELKDLFAINAARETGPNKRKKYRITEASLQEFIDRRSSGSVTSTSSTASAMQANQPGRPAQPRGKDVKSWIK